jgi:hypothetical protein
LSSDASEDSTDQSVSSSDACYWDSTRQSVLSSNAYGNSTDQNVSSSDACYWDSTRQNVLSSDACYLNSTRQNVLSSDAYEDSKVYRAVMLVTGIALIESIEQ